MSVVKTQKKVSAGPRKVVAKKAKRKKSVDEVIDGFVTIVRKHNVDFSFIKE